MNKLLILMVIASILYIGYTLIPLDLDENEEQHSSTVQPMILEKLKNKISDTSVEIVLCDELTMGIFLNNGYQLSIPYYWEIFEVESNSTDPLITKYEYMKPDKKQCAVLENKRVIDIIKRNSMLVFHFEDLMLVIDINYLTPDGATLIAVGNPVKTVFKLII